MRRVSVVGNSGSGKSTVGRAVAASLGVEYVEIDALHHLPGWTELPSVDLRATIDRLTQGDGWVVDGNYSSVLDLVWERADTAVWLDLPRPVVMRQVITRTARRMARREVLWNGNQERLREVLHPDPERSIIRWAWTRHSVYADRYEQRLADPRWSHLELVRLRNRADVSVFLNSLDAPRSGAP